MRNKKIEPIYQKLGKLIAERRVEVGMTQEKLAIKMRVSRPSVANTEAGRHRISIHHLFRAERALGYPYGYFIIKACRE